MLRTPAENIKLEYIPFSDTAFSGRRRVNTPLTRDAREQGIGWGEGGKTARNLARAVLSHLLKPGADGYAPLLDSDGHAIAAGVGMLEGRFFDNFLARIPRDQGSILEAEPIIIWIAEALQSPHLFTPIPRVPIEVQWPNGEYDQDAVIRAVFGRFRYPKPDDASETLRILVSGLLGFGKPGCQALEAAVRYYGGISHGGRNLCPFKEAVDATSRFITQHHDASLIGAAGFLLGSLREAPEILSCNRALANRVYEGVLRRLERIDASVSRQDGEISETEGRATSD